MRGDVRGSEIYVQTRDALSAFALKRIDRHTSKPTGLMIQQITMKQPAFTIQLKDIVIGRLH